MCAYANTVNKAAVRQRWDLPVLSRWKAEAGRPLTYFGLPGPAIHDLLDWRSVLDSRRTGIEEVGRSKKERLKADEASALLRLNVDVHGLSSGFQLLRGAVEDIILDGFDIYGIHPQMNDGAPAGRRRFSYDLVNLDFDGGLGYPDKRGAANRVNAIKRLFERQQGSSFVLLLTINVRDQLGDEVEEYLAGLQRRTRDRSELHECIKWHMQRGDGERAYKLKATVPSFIQSTAEGCMFKVKSRPPVAYEGYEHAHMLHFIFELESRAGNLRAFSDQDHVELVSLPLFRFHEGRLSFPSVQHPQFAREHALPLLEFLPEAMRHEALG